MYRKKKLIEILRKEHIKIEKRKVNKMKLGFLFPGQGSQSIGMGQDLYEKYDLVKEVYEKVKELTKIDIANISFCGSEEGLMAAIMGMDEKQVEEVCQKVTKGFVVPANYNTIGQIAISGEKEAVEQAEVIAKELGAKKVRILKTAGPFHTEKLIKASDKLREELEQVMIYDFKIPVVKNLDGTIYSKEEDIKDILAKHIVSPVRFSKSLQTMLDMGIDTFVEIGPRKNLIWICEKIIY